MTWLASSQTREALWAERERDAARCGVPVPRFIPADVKVRKAELMSVLRENRAAHQAAFLAAQAGYRKRVIGELDRRQDDARHGRKINLFFQLPEPEDHTEDYDREIRMLQMSVDDEVVISSRLFDQIVMDNWGWSAEFATTNAVYLVE